MFIKESNIFRFVRNTADLTNPLNVARSIC